MRSRRRGRKFGSATMLGFFGTAGWVKRNRAVWFRLRRVLLSPCVDPASGRHQRSLAGKCPAGNAPARPHRPRHAQLCLTSPIPVARACRSRQAASRRIVGRLAWPPLMDQACTARSRSVTRSASTFSVPTAPTTICVKPRKSTSKLAMRLSSFVRRVSTPSILPFNPSGFNSPWLATKGI